MFMRASFRTTAPRAGRLHLRATTTAKRRRDDGPQETALVLAPKPRRRYCMRAVVDTTIGSAERCALSRVTVRPDRLPSIDRARRQEHTMQTDSSLDLGKLQQSMHDLRSRIDDLEDRAAYQARHALRETDRAVRAHPYRAIAMAATAGLLVGLLALRR
jgi:ElaB/YqjD/DUF883 family membrane-anchored ribosome-binding protein